MTPEEDLSPEENQIRGLVAQPGYLSMKLETQIFSENDEQQNDKFI